MAPCLLGIAVVLGLRPACAAQAPADDAAPDALQSSPDAGCTAPCAAEDPEQLTERAAQFANGTEGAKDPALAAELFGRACEAGHARACSNLGVLYHKGEGVAQDDAQAALLFERACDAGHAAGCFNLGLLEQATNEDSDRALALFQKACDGGHAAACGKVQGSIAPTPPAPPSLVVPPQPAPERVCSIWHDDLPDDCWTPRKGVLSGGFVGFDVGYAEPHAQARERASIGKGALIDVRLGLEFWDQLLVTLSFGSFHFKDKAPTSELVITCEEYQGVTLSCDDEPYAQKSVVRGGHVSYEAGYQYRIRPHKKFSIAPAALVGYLALFRGIVREVVCEGCPDGQDLDLALDGAYLAGLLRITFGRVGFVSFMVRSQWSLTGDLRQVTSFGFEAFAP